MASHDQRRTDALAKGLRSRLTPRIDGFETLLAEARSESDFEDRQARRWQGQVNEESATWEGTLLDLAEAHAEVVLDTSRGTRIVGQLVAMGTDVVVVRRTDSSDLWVRRASIVMVGGAGSALLARGSREPGPATFQQLLFDAAATRPVVSVSVHGVATVLSGVLVSCGTDVCLIRADDDGRRSIVVHIPSIDEAAIRG